MKKFRLLLLDANIVIEISRHSLWDRIIAACEVHLAQTVVNEARFFDDDNGACQEIDLTPLGQNWCHHGIQPYAIRPCRFPRQLSPRIF